MIRGLLPTDPSSLCPQLNLLNPPPPNKISGYATGTYLPEWKVSSLKKFPYIAVPLTCIWEGPVWDFGQVTISYYWGIYGFI
jgi:hypothetical protein